MNVITRTSGVALLLLVIVRLLASLLAVIATPLAIFLVAVFLLSLLADVVL